MFGSALSTVIVGLLVLGVLVFVHELGHFLLAKWNGVGVLEFAVGFGKKIWQKRIGETRYSLGLIPLGGYVRMVGDDPRSLHTDLADADKSFSLEPVGEVDEEERKLQADPSRWFLNKGFLAKSAIVIAGPLFNIVFAWILAVGMVAVYGIGELVEDPIIGSVRAEAPADKAGLKEGDRIETIDGVPMVKWEDVARTVRASGGHELVFGITRGDAASPQKLDVRVAGKPEQADERKIRGEEDPEVPYLIGVGPSFRTEPTTFLNAVKMGTLQVGTISWLSVRGIYLMLTGQISSSNVVGPIGIVKEAGNQARRGFEQLLEFTMLLSIGLAVINMFPIPILDGGHLVFFVIELIRGKRVGLRVQEIANHIGLVLILGLMVFAIGNDLLHLIR